MKFGKLKEIRDGKMIQKQSNINEWDEEVLLRYKEDLKKVE